MRFVRPLRCATWRRFAQDYPRRPPPSKPTFVLFISLALSLGSFRMCRHQRNSTRWHRAKGSRVHGYGYGHGYGEALALALTQSADWQRRRRRHWPLLSIMSLDQTMSTSRVTQGAPFVWTETRPGPSLRAWLINKMKMSRAGHFPGAAPGRLRRAPGSGFSPVRKQAGRQANRRAL